MPLCCFGEARLLDHRFTQHPKDPFGWFARREWWSIPLPLGVPRPMIFSSLLLSLRFTRQREDNRFCSFPQRGRRGVKKKTAGDGHSNSLQRFFLASSLIGRTTVFVRCKYTSFPCCWETISELFHLWGRKTPFSISQRYCVPFCKNRVFFQKKVLLL